MASARLHNHDSAPESFSYWSPSTVQPGRQCFEISRNHDELIAHPLTDLGEVDHWKLDSELDRLLELFDWTGCTKLTFDLRENAGSPGAAVSLFVTLAKRPEFPRLMVTVRGLTAEQRRALSNAGLAGLWPTPDDPDWDACSNNESGSYLAMPCNS